MPRYASLRDQYRLSLANCKMRSSQCRQSQRGQVLIEYVLLSVVVLGVAMGLTRKLQEAEVLAAFVEKPWGSIAGMIEFGSWSNESAASMRRKNKSGGNLHPSSRQLSLKPNDSECR